MEEEWNSFSLEADFRQSCVPVQAFYIDVVRTVFINDKNLKNGLRDI
jgi:hypothetical protein